MREPQQWASIAQGSRNGAGVTLDPAWACDRDSQVLERSTYATRAPALIPTAGASATGLRVPLGHLNSGCPALATASAQRVL